MAEARVDSIGDTTAQRLGLTEDWESGKARVLEQFPDVEPFINAFFDDDLEGIESKAARRVRLMETNDPGKFESYMQTDSRMEILTDAASGQPTGDDRNQAYADLRDYVDTVYETGEAWKLRLWFDRKSASAREQVLTALQARPPIFYSRFDFELMGLKLTNKAANMLAYVDGRRENIGVQSQRELLDQRGEFLSGDAYEDLDRWVLNHLKDDKTFAKAIEARNTWGWALWQPEANLVNQGGKAGYAWKYVRDVTVDLNQQIINIGLHGLGPYEPDDEKEAWTRARMALLDIVEEFRDWSPVFNDQVDDFQRSALRGDPFIEWLMPDEYYPTGRVGDD